MAPALRLSYRNSRLWRTIVLQLQLQQQDGLYCDVTLQGGGGGEGLHVHSCVIAACCPYLAGLLAGSQENAAGLQRSCFRRVLPIPEVSSHYLLPLVRYMYTAELEVAPADVPGVLKAAKKLQIPDLEALKLERGRLVKTDSGTKLNRDCLGGKKHVQYAVTHVKNHGLGLIIQKNKVINEPSGPNKQEVEPCSRDAQEVEPRSRDAQEVEPRSRDAQEVEPCSRDAQEVEPCSWDAQEVEPCSRAAQEVAPCSRDAQEVEPCDHDAQEVEPCSLDTQEVEPCDQDAQEVEPCSRDAQEVEPCSWDAQEVEPFSWDAQEVEPNSQDAQKVNLCSQGTHDLESGNQDMQNVVTSQDPAEKPNISSSTLNVQNSPGTSDKANGCNPKILQDQNTELIAGAKSESYYVKSGKASHKRIRLDRGRSQIPADSEISKPKGQLRRSKAISASTSVKFERKYESAKSSTSPMTIGSSNSEISYLQCDDGQFQEHPVHHDLKILEPVRHQQQSDATAGEKHEHLKGLVDCTSSSAKIKTLYEGEGTDGSQCINYEMTELTVCSPAVRGVKETCFDLMTQETKNAVEQISASHSKSEPGMDYLIDENMNESTNESCGYGVEKVKLKKSRNGLSWEVVKEVGPTCMQSSEGKDQQLIVLEQLQQQILNLPSPMSPALDVGGFSPFPFMGESVWPDLSADSDTDVDVLG